MTEWHIMCFVAAGAGAWFILPGQLCPTTGRDKPAAGARSDQFSLFTHSAKGDCGFPRSQALPEALKRN